VGEISLPDASAGGEALSLVADEGSLLLVYFGYTSCPDVCPTTMADIRAALADLPEGDAGKVDLAMVTIDPGRDTGELLTGYVQSFVPGAHAIRVDDATLLRSTADAFGADYSVETAASGDIEVSHTGNLYAVDDQGVLRLQWAFGTTPEDLGRDLALLLDGAGATAT
jgi:protein SCO1/2